MQHAERSTRAAAPEVRSAGRVLDLLAHLQAQPVPQSLSAVAAALLLPKSSTLLLLRTLVGRGYAVRLDDDRYAARARPPVDPRPALLEAALPIMRELCARLNETVLLGVSAPGARIQVIAKEVGQQELRYDADLAHLRPAFCTAMGRIFLADLPPPARRRALRARKLRPLTPHSVTDPQLLDALLDQVAAEGHAVVEEQYALGGSGVAAPVRDGQGRLLAALDIASVTARFDRARPLLVAAAIEGAQRLSHRLRHLG
jgi:IclR family pca regulon transcriptional regulator